MIKHPFAMKSLLTAVFVLVMMSPIFSQEVSISQDIKVNSLIYGTLLKPKVKTNNLVILISGSGPTDRNGNQQMMQNNSLKMMAQGLANEGIASFRYDKRIFTLLKQNALQEDKLNFDDFIEDATSVINYFKNKRNFENIYVLGHSQGALVGLIASLQTQVSGYISLAGAGQSIDQVIIDQISTQMPSLKEETITAIKTLKEKGKVMDFSPALMSILRPSVQPFMTSWMKYHPAKEIAKLKIPTLIVNGTKDLQVSVQEAQILKEAQPAAQLEIIENMNHVLKTVSGNDLENAKTYNNGNLAINSTLITTISTFVKK